MAYIPQTPPGQGGLVTPAYMAQAVDNDQFLRANLGILSSALGYAKLQSASTFSFVGLTGNYSALMIYAFLKPNGGDVSTLVRFNGDTGNNYDYATISRTDGGSSAVSGNGQSGIGIYAASTVAMPWSWVRILLPNWKDSDKGKLAVAHGGKFITTSSLPRMIDAAGWWRSNDPITRVDILPTGGSYEAGSWAAIYATQHLS